MPRNATNRLRRAIDGGAVVTCMVEPYELWEVTYQPRWEKDTKPWYVAGQHYSGDQCQAWAPADLEAALAARDGSREES